MQVIAVVEVIRIVSYHEQKKSRGQVEAIVRLANGKITTRHILPRKEKEK